MLRALLPLLLLELCATSVMARGGGGLPVPRPTIPPLGTLTVVNECDEAVRVLVRIGSNTGDEIVLEPSQSNQRLIHVAAGTQVRATIETSLVSNATVNATATCSVKGNETTNVKVRCTIRRGRPRLHITCQTVATADAAGDRESQILLASGGGLTLLLLFGTLLGRAPRRRRPLLVMTSIDGRPSVRAMMGTILLTFTAAGPVMALEGGDSTSLFIRNGCDEAVQVIVAAESVSPTWGVSEFILEPDSSTTVPLVTGGKNTNVPVTAALVADSSVRTTESIRVRSNKTTSVEITCTLVSGQTTLKIGRPKGKAKHAVTAADAAREAEVLLASSGGLGLLLLLGTLLGRNPRRREPLTNVNEIAGSPGQRSPAEQP